MVKKIILGVVLTIIILFSVVLTNSNIQGYSRRNNVNCNNNCIYNENCTNNNCINQNCEGTGIQQRNQNCSNQNKNCTRRQYKRMCH